MEWYWYDIIRHNCTCRAGLGTYTMSYTCVTTNQVEYTVCKFNQGCRLAQEAIHIIQRFAFLGSVWKFNDFEFSAHFSRGLLLINRCKCRCWQHEKGHVIQRRVLPPKKALPGTSSTTLETTWLLDCRDWREWSWLVSLKPQWWLWVVNLSVTGWFATKSDGYLCRSFRVHRVYRVAWKHIHIPSNFAWEHFRMLCSSSFIFFGCLACSWGFDSCDMLTHARTEISGCWQFLAIT